MSLSEEERQELEALEMSLIEDDPRLAQRLRDGLPLGHMSDHPMLSSLIVIGGYILIMIGLGARSGLIGIMGLALTFTGCMWLITGIWSCLNQEEHQRRCGP